MSKKVITTLKPHTKRDPKVIESLTKPRLPKILTIDIETSPNVAYVWGLWNQNISISQLQESTRMISFAAKWYGESKVLFFSEHHDGRDEMVRAAWDLLDQADIVISYNGISFDVKHLQREFLMAGFTPPSPFKNVDLLRTVRNQFKFPSNKLDYVSQAIGIGQKLKHEGQELWNQVLAGNVKAWDRMKKYNIQDVKLTESLFDYLGSWIKDMPHLSIWTREPHACYRCNSKSLLQDGFGHTASAVYSRLHCQECGAWNRGIISMGKTYTRALK